ncbi:Protein FAR1-RELATED SEQUENCE 5 [Platanthera zijinensis]|uniref:Protein FAR1-RELATED SEQUENCE 5 n=1 Tax=Platanthera zijinensis TaxID=2320716 RepID=A0AAP0BF87_9ASPA
MGLNVRKHYANKSKKDNVITSRRFLCSKQGHRENDKRDHLVIEPRQETRTDCSARMGIILNRSTGKYYVHEFIAEHNHILHYAECTHMLSSQRTITDVQAFEVQLANDSGLTQKNSFDFFSNQAGGRANIGFTQRDQKNYLRSRRQREMAHGEVGFLLYYFQKKTVDDPSFFYAVQLDNLEQVTNIFWADARMRFDYELFGDVITFDTTFATNKEYRPFRVFAGFNQFRGIIIFGAALLYDETIDSFLWLFETFLEAHNLKKPKTMFTDQDAAMTKAIHQVIPETRHGLCTWHLMQNGIKHLGNLMKDGSYFLSYFKKIMFEFENEEKFEVAWKEMLSTFSVEENSWLTSIYKIKEKWAKCYMKTAVTLGMRSTQLSESLNGDLKDYLKSNFDLGSFFKHFERVIDDKRYKELQAEFESREKMSKTKGQVTSSFATSWEHLHTIDI